MSASMQFASNLQSNFSSLSSHAHVIHAEAKTAADWQAWATAMPPGEHQKHAFANCRLNCHCTALGMVSSLHGIQLCSKWTPLGN